MIQTPLGLGAVAVWILLLLCGTGQSIGAEPVVDMRGRESFQTELQKIRESARTPEEMVAKVDELLRAHPRPVPESRQPREKRPMPAFADRVLTEDEALRLEARKVLWETRGSARTPEEEVALVDEFLRINKEVLASLRPKPRSEAEMRLAEQARKEMLESRVSENPDDLLAQAALVLWEIRQEAQNPSETVAGTDEFYRINRDVLSEFRKMKRAEIFSKGNK